MNKNKRVQITHFHLSTAKLKRKVFHLNLNNVRTEEKRQKFPSNKIYQEPVYKAVTEFML